MEKALAQDRRSFPEHIWTLYNGKMGPSINALTVISYSCTEKQGDCMRLTGVTQEGRRSTSK